MSTRATIHFEHAGAGESGKAEAIVYRHSDGYPEGLGVDLQRFIAKVGEMPEHDRRFDDPAYLAAKWVVWDAAQYRQAVRANDQNPLNFLGVGIVSQDPGDIEYRYHVVCDGEPKLRGESVRYDNDGKLVMCVTIKIPAPEKEVMPTT